MCATELGCLLCVPQGRSIYFQPHRRGASILCFLGHSVSNMCLICMWMSILCLLGHGVSNMGLTWQWMSILCPTGQGCLFCASWYTEYLIFASTGRGCLFCAQQGRGIYCVPHRTWVSIVCLLGHRVSDMCLPCMLMSI